MDGVPISIASTLTMTNVTGGHTLYLDTVKKRGTDIDTITFSFQ